MKIVRAIFSFFRRMKAIFMLLRLHVLFKPLVRPVLNVMYLAKLSEWVHAQKKLPFNDFYSSRFDYNKRYDLYAFILNSEGLKEPVCYMEFGVSNGHSFRWWIEQNKHPDSRFYGFDTFTGLPEDWGYFKAGSMATNVDLESGLDKRGRFVKGLFQDTLPGFLKEVENKNKKIILLDADLYSSTLFVLTSIAPYLQKGDVVIFDEFNVPRHEFLAYLNFVQSYYIKMEPVAAVNNYYCVAFKLV